MNSEPTTTPRHWLKRTAILTALLALTACGGGGGSTSADTSSDNSSTSSGNDSDTDNSTGNTDTSSGSGSSGSTTPIVVSSTSGRLLASNCFQCHGTEGTGGFDNIRGESAGELKEFLSEPANGNIMAAHLQGYTTAQIDAIAAYLNQ